MLLLWLNLNIMSGISAGKDVFTLADWAELFFKLDVRKLTEIDVYR